MGLKKTAAVLAFACVMYGVALGGTSFTYQGRLLDNSSGTPQGGTFDFRFKLYDSLTDGNQQGTDVDKTGVPVQDGYFTVELDFGDSVFNGQDCWLQVEVYDSTTYVPLNPRHKITASPYTIHTEWTDTDKNLKTTGDVTAATLTLVCDYEDVEVSGTASVDINGDPVDLNGTYVYNGLAYGKPTYVKGNCIIEDDTMFDYWQIKCDDISYYRNLNSGDDATPPSTGWTAWNSGVDPAPTLSGGQLDPSSSIITCNAISSLNSSSVNRANVYLNYSALGTSGDSILIQPGSDNSDPGQLWLSGGWDSDAEDYQPINIRHGITVHKDEGLHACDISFIGDDDQATLTWHDSFAFFGWESYFSFSDEVQVDEKLYFDTDQYSSIYYDGSNLIISPDEVGVGGVKILTTYNSNSSKLYLIADRGDDNGDSWFAKAADGGALTLANNASGNYVPQLTITPDASQTASNSTVTMPGNLEVNGDATLGDDSTDEITHAGRMLLRTVIYFTSMNSDVAGSTAEMVFCSTDSKFYGCTAGGAEGSATWVALH